MSADANATPAPLGARAALGLMAVVVVVWGMNWPVMKVALVDIPPLAFALARLILGVTCLFAVLAVRGELRLPSRADLPVILSVGLLQLAAFMSLITLGLEHVEAGRSAILAYTTPIWVAPLAAVIVGERLTAARLVGIGFGLAGVAVLFNPVTFDWHDRGKLLGNAFLLCGALAWAIAIVHVRRHRFALSPLQLAPWQMALAIVPVAVLAALTENPADIHPDLRLWAALAYNGPFATAFTLWAWVSVNRALPAITTAMASLAVPVVGLLASAVALGERITFANGVGLALIAAGIAAITVGNTGKSGS